MEKVQVVIIGGGSAGLSAAVTLKKKGIENIVVLEKDEESGGILQQCIHNGFGLQTFHEQLSGPEYAERFIDQAREFNVDIRQNTMVMHIGKDKTVEYVNPKEGYVTLQADAIILAVGCYERNRGAVEIAGERPAGIYTAGQAQKYLNMDGYLVGKNVFILGSGDIGLIMARRMTLEGAKVLGVAEIMPYSSGLPRNLKQCLEDFNIPLYLSHTVTKVFGHDRLERIEVSEVDENRKAILGTETYYDVDTLLLSTGLIPENHLAEEINIEMNKRTKGPIVDEYYMTSVEGIFACGNGLHVHDLVDFVTLEASRSADGVIHYLETGNAKGKEISAIAKENVSYVVPCMIHPFDTKDTEFFFRVTRPLENVSIKVVTNGKVLKEIKKKHMMPSEMERVKLTAKELSTLENDLEIKVEELSHGN